MSRTDTEAVEALIQTGHDDRWCDPCNCGHENSVQQILREIAIERDTLQWRLDMILLETGQRPLLDRIDALTKERDALAASLGEAKLAGKP